LLAAAAHEGYVNTDGQALSPYHGYYYKLLGSQGASAAGGAYSYTVGGKQLAGFAVLAYPARYGASGVMSFWVNQDGAVFEKNLHTGTARAASGLTAFNPDPSWRRVFETSKPPAVSQTRR
jgi:Protein of unknown function (DUF2950)